MVPQPHRFSAGVVVVRRGKDGPRYLLLRAYRNWDFPKGEIEPGEEPLAAARRETAEEAGISRLAFRWGEAYRETAPYGRGKVARYYLAESAEEARLDAGPDRPEHHEYRWADASEAERLLPPRLRPVLSWARERVENGARHQFGNGRRSGA